MSFEYRSVDTLGPQHRGHRVTVRRKLSEGGYTDIVGVLEHIDISSANIRTHKGDVVTIPRSEIAAARVVEAPPLKNPTNPAPG